MRWYAIRLTGQDVVRTERASSPQQACKLAFGVLYFRGEAVFKVLPKKPCYLTIAQRQELNANIGHWLPLTK